MHHATSGARLPWLLLLAGAALPWLVHLARRTEPARAAQVLAAGTLLAAAALHGAAAMEHAGGQRAAFLLVALVQLGLAALVLTRPEPALVVGVAVVSALAVAVWLETRTAGLLFGVEAVRRLDAACVAAELVTLLCCRTLRRERPTPVRIDGEVAGWALIVGAGALAAAA